MTYRKLHLDDVDMLLQPVVEVLDAQAEAIPPVRPVSFAHAALRRRESVTALEHTPSLEPMQRDGLELRATPAPRRPSATCASTALEQ